MKTIWSFDLGKASIGEAGTPPASTRAKCSNDVMNRINSPDVPGQ